MGLFGLGGDSNSSGAGMLGIGTLAGGAIMNVMGQQQQNAANSYMSDHVMDRQEDNARMQMQFQERMSNSAYQRATADMRAAGINPMMAANQGGASTPAGASGGGGGARMENVLSGLSSSAMDVMRLKNETGNAESMQALNHALGAKAVADTASAGASAKESAARTDTILSQLAATKKEADVRSIKADYDKKAAAYDSVMSRVNRDSGSAKNLMNMFGGPKGGPAGSLLMNGQTGEILKQY